MFSWQNFADGTDTVVQQLNISHVLSPTSQSQLTVPESVHAILRSLFQLIFQRRAPAGLGTACPHPGR